MGQQVDSRRVRAFPWLVAAFLLVVVFLGNNWELVSGVRVQIWDAFSFYTPAFSLVADHVRAGRLLRWDPWLAGGTPDFADPQVGAASPIAILFGAIGGGNAAAFRAYWLFIWILGPLGLIFLARHLGAPPWGAFLVALGYAFCGFYTAHAEHTTVVYAFSFVPWVIWRFDVALTTRRLVPATQAGALWGLSALGGYPAIVTLAGGMLFLWGLGRCCCRDDDKAVCSSTQTIRKQFAFTVLALGIVFCIGVLILAPTYLAFFREGLGYTERAGPMTRWAATAAAQNALDPRALATFASPYLTALKVPYRNPDLWPHTDVSMADVYVGVLPLILSLLALCQRPRSGWRWWLVGIGVFFLACAVGDRLPIRGWLYDYCFPTRYFTHPAMFRGFAMFAVAILAVLATTDLEAAIRNPQTRIWQLLSILSLIASVAAVCAYAYVVSWVSDLGDQFPLSNMHLIGMWFGTLGVSLLLLMFRKARRWVPILFVVLAVVDACLTLHLSQKFISDNGRTRSLLSRIDARHKHSLRVKSLQRTLEPAFFLGGAHSNNNVTLRIATLYNDSTMRNRFHISFAQHPSLREMGLGADRIWFATDAVAAAPSLYTYNALMNRSDQLGAPVLVVHSRSEMVNVSRIITSGRPDIAQLASIARLAPAQQVPAQLLRYTPNDVKLKVSSPQDGWILVTDRWAAGWRAKVNGIPTDVFGGNFIYRAVRVRAGENTIQFYYPQPLYFGLVVLSWGTLVAVFAIPVFKSRLGTTMQGASVGNLGDC